MDWIARSSARVNVRTNAVAMFDVVVVHQEAYSLCEFAQLALSVEKVFEKSRNFFCKIYGIYI